MRWQVDAPIFAIIAAAAVVATSLVAFADGYTPFVVALVALSTIVGVGLNILVGLSGQISIGHVGFYAIGAYVYGILSAGGLSFWLALTASALVARGHRRASGNSCPPCVRTVSCDDDNCFCLCG